MKEETKHTISHVTIEEYYSKEDGVVFYHRRINGGEWEKMESPHKEIPWIEIKTHAFDAQLKGEKEN